MTTKRSLNLSSLNQTTTCLLLLITLLSFSSHSSCSESNGNKKCVLRGICGEASGLLGGNMDISCHDPHDPTIVGGDALDTLYEICPELVKDKPLVCCSTDQIYAMNEAFNLPMQLRLSQCPSCLHNWRSNFCQMVCSPHQADFTGVTTSEVLPDGRRKGVQSVDSGTSFLDFMCGSWGAAECTGPRWLEYIGTSIENGGPAPYQVNYKFYGGVNGPIPSGAIRPMDVRTFKCSEAPSAKSLPCSCSDCEDSCKLRGDHL